MPLSRNVLAVIFKALVARLLADMRPFPITLPPLILLSGHSFSQETKVALLLPLAHIPSHFAENRHRPHDVDAIDLD
jgi:hypothetical protein